jgi:ubiquinone/menaquinone biosynthesis C-methylase UbiE
LQKKEQGHGLQNIVEFKEINAENLSLGLPQSSPYFNAILCRWGLMSLADLSGALDNIYGLLADEGCFATAVWSIPSKVPLLSIPVYIVAEQLGLPSPLPRSPGPFSLSDIDALENSLSRVGFKNIHSETLTVTFEFASAQEYVRFVQEISTPIQALLSKESTERREKLDDNRRSNKKIFAR